VDISLAEAVFPVVKISNVQKSTFIISSGQYRNMGLFQLFQAKTGHLAIAFSGH
jgi:hypothetical protein